MKHLWLWLLAGAAAIAALWYYLTHKAAAAPTSAASTQNTGTAGGPAAWFAGWLGYSQNTMATTNSVSQSAFGALSQISNAFGLNDGGNSGGVSISGSGFGGAASSGSGAGVPTTNATSDNCVSDTLGLDADDSNPQSQDNYSDLWDTGYDDTDFEFS